MALSVWGFRQICVAAVLWVAEACVCASPLLVIPMLCISLGFCCIQWRERRDTSCKQERFTVHCSSVCRTVRNIPVATLQCLDRGILLYDLIRLASSLWGVSMAPPSLLSHESV